MPSFVRVLAALFMVAQFSGVVSSPGANAEPIGNPVAAHAHYHHGHDHADATISHHQDHDHLGGAALHRHGDGAAHLADACCALHAYFVGMMPPVIAIATVSVVGEPLGLAPDNRAPGVPTDRLDRPPRPLR